MKSGDIVTLTENAVYYTGSAIPSWVKQDRWIVKSVSGDRVIIDKNVGGTRAINSPVGASYLKVVGSIDGGQAGAAVSAAAGKPAPAPAPAAPGTKMQVSDRGVELVAKYEGCRLTAYKCPAGVWTIGYGHTAGVKEGDTLPSKEAARALLQTDLAKYAASVNNCIQKGILTFQPNQNQFDALTSFCYNCGAGNLQKLVSGRDIATVADKMLAYNKGGGKVLPGLVRRREEERALFLS